MKKIWKYAVAVTVMCLAISMNVSARDYLTQENFDYEWYLQKHPELASTINVNDQEAIWNFYVTEGQAAGWIGRVAVKYLIPEQQFDAAKYAEAYPDVAAAMGTDPSTLYQHYITCGIAEGRTGYATNEETTAKLKVYALSKTLTQGCKSDREKVKAIHDWLVINVAYDYDNFKARTIPRSSYGLAGPILHGKSVCQGYATAFQYFMDVLGIECQMISGTASNSLGTGGHSWNKVKLDGEWLYIDVTWDDPVPDRGRKADIYDYYLTKDPTFGGDHHPGA